MAPGPDGDWFTPDDPVDGYREWVYDGAGLMVRTIQYSSDGADGVWFTADDDREYEEFSYDADDNRLEMSTCQDPGPDAVWYTGDDILDESFVYLTGF